MVNFVLYLQLLVVIIIIIIIMCNTNSRMNESRVPSLLITATEISLTCCTLCMLERVMYQHLCPVLRYTL